ncbi:MAG: hypothetical protein GY854_25090 [Deltaproteobacteria bacterium]|nr:hypothetical protein [Deltaproteobacteria bacterium]
MKPIAQKTVQVFVISRASAPAGPPSPAGTIEIEATSKDGFLTAARSALEADGLRLRALSFSPTGMVAYVEEVP